MYLLPLLLSCTVWTAPVDITPLAVPVVALAAYLNGKTIEQCSIELRNNAATNIVANGMHGLAFLPKPLRPFANAWVRDRVIDGLEEFCKVRSTCTPGSKAHEWTSGTCLPSIILHYGGVQC